MDSGEIAMPSPQIGEDVTDLMPDVGQDVTSLMGDGEDRTWTDTAVDAMPAIGSGIGGLIGLPLGGPVGAGIGAAIGGAGGEGWRQIVQKVRGKGTLPTREVRAKSMLKQGAIGGASELTGLAAARGAAMAGKGLMRGAMGAQTAIRRRFPTVDLERIALREGVGPRLSVSARSVAANDAVPLAGRAADAAGAAKVQPREMTAGLRGLYDKAKQTRMKDQMRQIVDEANHVRNTYRGGLSVEDALATKSELASQAKGVMQGAADPRSASTSKKILGSLSRATGNAAKSRGQGVEQALTKSQELMALDKALGGITGPSRLRLLFGAGAGVTSGLSSGDPLDGITGALSTYALTSPRALSTLAQLLSRGAPVVRQAPRALAGLMSSHGKD